MVMTYFHKQRPCRLPTCSRKRDACRRRFKKGKRNGRQTGAYWHYTRSVPRKRAGGKAGTGGTDC